MVQTGMVLNDWIRLVRAEYSEFPGLHLTRLEMQRLWMLDETTCDSVVGSLESDGFLRRTRAGAYVRND
jgi:putative heme degradation protein